jgi:hypothetical protein
MKLIPSREAAAAIRLKETLKPLKITQVAPGVGVGTLAIETKSWPLPSLSWKPIAPRMWTAVDWQIYKDTFGRTDEFLMKPSLMSCIGTRIFPICLAWYLASDFSSRHTVARLTIWIVPPDTQWNATSPHRLGGMQWSPTPTVWQMGNSEIRVPLPPDFSQQGGYVNDERCSSDRRQPLQL